MVRATGKSATECLVNDSSVALMWFGSVISVFSRTSLLIMILSRTCAKKKTKRLKGFKFRRLVEVLLYVHRNRRLIRDGSPGRPPRLSHSS